jgi:hypothetical protein
LVGGKPIGEGILDKAVDLFAEDPGRFERFRLEFMSQRVIDDVMDAMLERYREAMKLRGGEEQELYRLVVGFCFAKAHKTFHATQRLCALGFGEDAAILLRSNINLLINMHFILRNDNPVERCKEFIDYSVYERRRYIDSAHQATQPDWMEKVGTQNPDEMKARVKKWKDNTIKTRAKSMGDERFQLHYMQGYRFYSSLEHADVMALVGYIDENESGFTASSAARDDYIGLVLAHNVLVMGDILIGAINYFSLPCPDLVEKLTATYQALNRYAQD